MAKQTTSRSSPALQPRLNRLDAARDICVAKGGYLATVVRPQEGGALGTDLRL